MTEKREVHVILACGAQYEYEVDGIPVIARKEVLKDIRKNIEPTTVICHEQDYHWVKQLTCAETIVVVAFTSGSELVAGEQIEANSLTNAYYQAVEQLEESKSLDMAIFVVANPNFINELNSQLGILSLHKYVLNRSDRRGIIFDSGIVNGFNFFMLLYETATQTLKGGDSMTVYRHQNKDLPAVETSAPYVSVPVQDAPLDIRSFYLIEKGDIRLLLSQVSHWAPTRVGQALSIAMKNGAEFSTRYASVDERDEALEAFDKTMSDYLNHKE